jgi:Sulfotransferase family
MLSRDPVFIGGMFKSGTSLLRAMLGRHSRIFAGLETQWLAQDGRNAPAERREWLDRLAIFFDVPRSALEQAVGDEVQADACLDRLMRLLSTRDGKPRWAEKTPYNVSAIDRILTYWPDAKIIHVVRDPRDVYASMVEIEKWKEPAVFANHWCNTVVAARDWLGGEGYPAYHELRYEKLVLAPETIMREALAFLGEPWEPAVAMFDGRPQDFERVQRATGKLSATLRRLALPLTDSRIGVWAKIIGQKGWEPIRGELSRRGYERLVAALIAETDAVTAEAERSGCLSLVGSKP